MTKVRIFLPALNVSKHIDKLLYEFEAVRGVIRQLGGFDLEVLVIDDASTDDTAQACYRTELVEEGGWLTIRSNESNLGNGANIIAGYQWACEGADIVGCMDADGEHSPYALIRHLGWLNFHDCDSVVGSIIFPDHDANHNDRNMMRFYGGMQASLAGVDGMFYIQSPGYNLHQAEHVQEALALLPEYRKFFEANSLEAFPRWGMHGVMIHLIAKGAGAHIKAAYLECFGQSPNRTPDKLLLQANAAAQHGVMLDRFFASRT